MSSKLTNSDMDVLEAFIGTGPKTFNLLYSIDGDGCSPQSFHKHCDNKGPTVTVLYNKQGSVFGAYTSLSWQSSGGWQKDLLSFLFRLKSSGKIMPTKFHLHKKDTTHVCFTDEGPYFGDSKVFVPFSKMIYKQAGVYPLNGSMNRFGDYYENQGLNASDINNGTMDVTDLEVYSVIDDDRQGKRPVYRAQWRNQQHLNEKLLASLKEELCGIQLLPLVSEYRVLILGPRGTGKSSFVDTVDSVFRGRSSQRAVCGTHDKGMTVEFTPYTMKSESGSLLKFRLCDTPDISGDQGLDATDCGLLLDGHVPDFYQFNPSVQLRNNSPEFVKEPKLEQQVHCVAFVIDAITAEDLPEDIVKKCQDIKGKVIQRGIPHVVLLTKIDKASEILHDDVRQVFYCNKIGRLVDKVADTLGFPRNRVLPVKNYERDIEFEESTSALALLALQQMIHFAEDYIANIDMKMGRRQGAGTFVADMQEVCESDTA